MSEYLKQLILQLKQIWEKLNPTQKGVLVATTAVVLAGLITIVAWNSGGTGGDGAHNGYTTLFTGLEPEDAAKVTAVLKDSKTPYQFDNDGHTILVPKDKIYDTRMDMAQKGLPESGVEGYELFDKVQIGMTDFVQNLDYKRALEGELTRTIETIREVDKARVHVMIPKPTLFTDNKVSPTASVILRLRPGAELTPDQIVGITHLVASSIEGLKASEVAVLDSHGNLLTKDYGESPLAEQTDHNLMIQGEVEDRLERKVSDIFNGLLGPGNVRVKAAVDLDMDQVQKTVESYDPNTKVIRSQQRDDGMIKGSPTAQMEQKEGSITNYEFDKTVANIVATPGAVNRMTISVAVDGSYKTGPDGKTTYVPRTPEELDKFTALVKNAVGYRPDSKDEVYVTNVQFDRQLAPDDEIALRKVGEPAWLELLKQYGILLLIVVFGFIFLRGLARNLSSAMNPPRPRYAGVNLDYWNAKVPENVQKQKDILEKVEIMTRTEPLNIANLIKTWIHDGSEMQNRDAKKAANKR